MNIFFFFEKTKIVRLILV